MELSLTLIILAGGRGERLGGVVKPLLKTKSGRTILEVIADELGPHVAGMVIVAPVALSSSLDPTSRFSFVADEGTGPASALLLAALATQVEWLLVVGGDQPRPSRHLLVRLRSHAADGVDAVIVEVEGVRQPLWALYRRAAVVAAPACVSLQRLLAVLRTEVIDGASLTEVERECFLDVDTPEDLRLLGLH